MGLKICMQLLSIKDVMVLIWLIFYIRDELIEEKKYKYISIEEKQIYKQNGQAQNPGL